MIALVITIIVILILAGVGIATLTSDNGLISKAIWASFNQELASVDENINLEWINNAAQLYIDDTNYEALFSEEDKVEEGTMPTTLLTELEGLNGSIDDLYWVSKKLGNGKENTYVYDTKIKVVFKVNGIEYQNKTIHSIKGPTVESTTAVMEVSATYGYYEPDLNGFDLDDTYIVYYSEDCQSYYSEMTLQEYLDNGKPREHEVIVDGVKTTYYFHNYQSVINKSIWGNVITKANGLEAWWVWIPRYAYYFESDSQTNVVFTNTNNDSLNSEVDFNGSNISEKGYIPHKAFTLQDNDGTELKGIWMAKYQASTTENSSDASYELEYYAPKLKGYNINTTYIATYDASGNEVSQYLLKDVLESGYMAETNGTLISGEVDKSKIPAGEYWYDYNNKIWGNIITKANGLEAWWVWIPRYAYYFISDSTTDIVFITTSNKLFNGKKELGLYNPHPAFTLQDGTELEGIWMAKYQASTTENSSDASYELEYYAPKLKGFNINTTYIATYDASGNEANQYLLSDVLTDGYETDEDGALISGEVDKSKIPAGEYWYDYNNKIWGNIVTKAHELEAWWVWIPRYAYYFTSDSATDIVFITTSNKLFNGKEELGLYNPHPAFTLQDGTELEGIWMAKYQAGGELDSEEAIIEE